MEVVPPPPHFLLSGYSVHKFREAFYLQISLILPPQLEGMVYLVIHIFIRM